ncbi:hypothetical protein HPB47_015781, partial [Ixodes persulcatus]
WSTVNPKQVKDSVSLTDASGKGLSIAETCELFCTLFSEVLTDEVFPLPSYCPEYFITTQRDHIIVTNDVISKLISNLPSNSAPGPDLITTKLLKITSDISSALVSRIFQKSLGSGVVPADWKSAMIVPIFKDGAKDVPTNFRPISLTSVV